MTFYRVNNYVNYYRNFSEISNNNCLTGRENAAINKNYKINNIIRFLKRKKNSSISDVGCRNSLLLRKLAKQEKNLKSIGTLPTDKEIYYVNKILRNEKLNKIISIKKLNLESYNYHLNKTYFNFININSVIQYIKKDNYLNLISKLNKLCKSKRIFF